MIPVFYNGHVQIHWLKGLLLSPLYNMAENIPNVSSPIKLFMKFLKLVPSILKGPRHAKMCLWAYVYSKDPDQHEHLCSLISAFAVLNRII